jgi:hypothetical protein
MKVKVVDKLDYALQIVEGMQDFCSRMDFQEFIPQNPTDFADALSRIVMMEQVYIIGAVDEGKLVGMIGMAYMPHTWNPKILHAEEIFWWAAPDAPVTTSMRLLKKAKEHAKEMGANMITFRALTSSPAKTGDVYKRMGLKEIETTYSGSI